MEKQKCPEVRFKEFVQDWGQSNFLENIQSIIDFRGRTPKKLGMDWSKKGYLALSALNVKNGYIDSSIDAHYGDEKLYQKWMSGNELKKGQVLFTTEAPMGNVAQVPDDKGYILSQRTIAFNVEKNKISDEFLAVLLGSPNVFNRLSGLCSGGTAKGVSQKSLSTLDIIFPLQSNEQKLIGNFFQNLDQSIALHEKKLTQTQNLKKAMLEKMFPKAGSTQPEIRLKGFSGDWFETTVGNISTSFSGGTPSVLEKSFYGGEIPFIRSGEISDISTKLFLTKSGLENSSAKLVEKGTILYALYGATSGEVSISLISGAINQAILAIKPINKNSTLFLASWLRLNKMRILETYLQGGQGNLSGQIVKNIEIQIPCSFEEQLKIGQFFKQLDETLVLQQQQLQILKNLKQAFLEKMFV